MTSALPPQNPSPRPYGTSAPLSQSLLWVQTSLIPNACQIIAPLVSGISPLVANSRHSLRFHRKRSLRARRQTEIAKRFHILKAAVVHPRVQIGHILQLLAAPAGHRDIAAFQFRQGAHVAPEFLELQDRKDILLTPAPAALDLFDRGIGGQPFRDPADGGGEFRLRPFQ